MTTSAAATAPTAGSYLYYRHKFPVRVMHWINVIAFTVLFMSGLQVFNAYPALNWGGTSYVVFYCADPMGANNTDFYYESIDLDDAVHPQTILAYDLNDATLPVPNGAPLRLRVERQLGYKHAKYITGIEFVASFDKIAGGKGGYWEDQGYHWWAGI